MNYPIIFDTMKTGITHDTGALARLLRYYSIVSTREAGSGHPSSSLSAADLMSELFFGGHFRFRIDDPRYPNNDRLIFSKGHAAPLFYALWAAAGAIDSEETLTLRKFSSRLEGHPLMTFPYTEAATGSLGQGLSVGLGMALAAKYIDELPYRTYVLLGDSEMAEGSIWEAMSLAAHYKLGNLIAIVDVNRLGQHGETMFGWNTDTYDRKARAFGWETIVIDGHDMRQIKNAYAKAGRTNGKPLMIIAKTIKGKGVSSIENKNGWHGKPLTGMEAERALEELGPVETDLHGTIRKPAVQKPKAPKRGRRGAARAEYRNETATREALGQALVRIYEDFPHMVVIDAEVSNSTKTDFFKEAYPKRFFEMFIAEQNMAGTALGLSRRGKKVFASTFAAFWSRAHDQIRMVQYSNPDIVFVGSHAGVSIGEDGASQMGLDDIAMFRSMIGSAVLYPADAYAAEALAREATAREGLTYIRTTRGKTPVIYKPRDAFPIGGSKVLKSSAKDAVTVVGAGVTLFEALKAYGELRKEKIAIRVIDLYSVKPVDQKTLKKAARETGAIITVEDHHREGGLGEAVLSALADAPCPVYQLGVTQIPKSGTPEELLRHQGISSTDIAKHVKAVVTNRTRTQT